MREQILKPGRATLVAMALVVATLLGAASARAQTTTANVTLAINTTQARATPIPSDFSGLSFEMGSVIFDSVNNGWYLSANSSAMVALLKTLGIKSVRVGGNSAETGNIATAADEDAVLDFCHAIGGNLIWDLEVDGSLYDPAGQSAIAQSMHNYATANNYGNLLVFQVGNEPDLTADPTNPGHNKSAATYDAEFSSYVAATNQLYSGSEWAGPDTSAGGTFYSATFCPTEAAAWPGQITFVCQHLYPFGSSLTAGTIASQIATMLSASNEAGYLSFNNQWVPPAVAAGLAPRYEECNSYFHNGSFGSSDAFASALWGLGWMYYQAQAGLAGINFHTGENSNDPAYNALTPANLATSYTVHPLAYAIKAFDLGGHGNMVPVTIGNTSNVNLVAYSVLQGDGSLVVTVINRTYGSPDFNANLSLTTSGATYNAGQVMFLTAVNNDPTTTTGVTLGGSAISGVGVWNGTYLGMAGPAGGSFALTVPATQAAIIRLFNAAGPAAPANLTATAGNSQATLQWNVSSGATGYVVQRSSTTGGPYTTIASGVTTNSYTDTTVSNGQIYYYVVAATNNNGVGPQSAEAAVSLSTLPPLAPTGLTAIPGDGVVALSWTASVGATSYVLERGTASGQETTIVSSTITGTSYTDTGLTDGVTYYYVVSAVGPYGQGVPSTEVSASPFVSTGIAWTNTVTASPQSWNVNANWSTAAFPSGAQTVALINAPITASQTIDLNQNITIGELNIGASGGAASFNLTGNGGTLTFDNAPATPSLTQLASSKGDTISAPLSINGSLNVYNASANPLTLSGNISGTNNLVMNNGTVILAGVTGFNGTTIIAQGTLELANALALQNSTLNYSGGTLAFSGITAATLGGLNGTQNLSLINLAAAPLALTVGAENSNTTYAGAFTGGGSLTKTGTGTLTLTGANNHTGGTTVLGGNLTLAGGTLGSSGSTILVGNGATGVSFDVTGGTVTAATLNVAPNGGSTGDNVSITGTGSATFNSVNLGSGSDTSGPLTINTTGSVSLGAFIDFKDLQGNGPSTTSGLIINGGTVTAASVIIQDTTSGANMNMNGGSLTIGNTSSTGAFKIGNSTSTRGGFLTMTGGSLTYLGTDGLLLNTASGGANGANISGANAVATLSGVTLNQVNAAGATSSLVVSSGATLYLGGVGLVLNQPGGAVTASFANATVGAIANWTSSAPITLAGATTFQTANGSAVAHSISLGGVLSGAGALTETGLGTLTLSGIDTYTGPTTVSAGTLVLTGSLAGSATVQSGATLGGTGKITGNLTVSSGAGFLLNASGNLSVTGNLTWNGNLTVTGASGLPVGNYTLLGYNGTLSGSPAFTYVPPSGASQAATFSTATAHVITVTVFGPPSPPTGLTAAPGNGNVTLNWTGSAGATSYTVQRSTTSGGGYTTVATGVTGTTYKDTTPSNGTPYYYIVVANNAAGAGAGSTQAVATPVAPPAAPSDLAATAGNGNNTLTWSPVSGAANYTLARATAPGVETPLAAGLAAGPYLDTNVTNGTTYYYILTATNAGGTGPGSPEVSATPAATLAQWASAAFGNSTNANLTGPDANPSGDGIPNLLKYFYGLDPATNSGTPPVSTAPDNSGNLLLTFHLSKNLTGVTYQIQSSPDLLNWTNTGVQATEVSDQGAYYIMQASVPLGSNPYLYLRIKVTGP